MQHNCRLFDCPVKLSRQATQERQATHVKTVQVEHLDDRHFIINIALLSNQQLHSDISDLSYQAITPNQWVKCVTSGFETWLQTDDEDDILPEDEEEEMEDEDEFTDYSSDLE